MFYTDNKYKFLVVNIYYRLIISIMSSLFQWVFQSAMSPFSGRLIGFDDVRNCIKRPEKYAIIHTMPASEKTLIRGTMSASEEETFINEYLTKYIETPKTIVLYGRNSCDDSPIKKQTQLISLGINDVYIYSGGMFEWVLLQDVYGKDEFPVCGETENVDILSYSKKDTLH